MDNQKELTLSENYIKNLYERSNEVEKNLLEKMFGRSLFNPDKVIMERIKTFNDACDEIGHNHPLVLEYDELTTDTNFETKANIAFTKLKIIAKALNGQCNLEIPNHKRWFPRFFIKQMNTVNTKTIDNYVVWINRNGIYFAYDSPDFSGDLVDVSAQADTCFRTRELAEYAGKQFIDIYADLIL